MPQHYSKQLPWPPPLTSTDLSVHSEEKTSTGVKKRPDGRQKERDTTSSTPTTQARRPLAELDVGNAVNVTNGRKAPPLENVPGGPVASTHKVPLGIHTGNKGARRVQDGTSPVGRTPDSPSTLVSTDEKKSIPSSSVPRIKFRVYSKTFKGVKETMAMSRRRYQNWVELFDKTRLTSSLKSSRMADSTAPAQKHSSATDTLRKVLSIHVTGESLLLFITVKIGKRIKTKHDLMVDTGSLLTWVPAADYNNPKTRSAADLTKVKDRDEMNSISFAHMDAELEPSLYKDDFEINGVRIQGQEFGVVEEIPEKLPMECRKGMFALAPDTQSAKLVDDDSLHPIASPVDNLVKQGRVDAHVIRFNWALWDGSDSEMKLSGSITIGKLEEAIERHIRYIQLTQSLAFQNYLAVDMDLELISSNSSPTRQSSTKLPIMKNRPGMFDSGFPYIFFAPDVFDNFAKEIGAKFHEVVGMWYIKQEDFRKLKDFRLRLRFLNGKRPIEADIVPDAFVLPPNYTKDICEGSKNLLFLVINRSSSEVGDEIPPVVMGNVFFQRFTVVYKKTSKGIMIGIAPNSNAYRTWPELH